MSIFQILVIIKYHPTEKTTMKLFVLVAFCMVIVACDALSCPTCNKKKCPYLYCRGRSEVPNPCECCNECAKLEGEECGGPWHIYGKCDPRRWDLDCVKGPICDKKPTKDFNAKGICMRRRTVKIIKKYCNKYPVCMKE
uniref:venom protein 302-like n=1 Tax=Styela clava TaxID=7725 RepID=UPI00193AD2A0|nr:venom protein 302-like [Styela clava]